MLDSTDIRRAAGMKVRAENKWDSHSNKNKLFSHIHSSPEVLFHFPKGFHVRTQMSDAVQLEIQLRLTSQV